MAAEPESARTETEREEKETRGKGSRRSRQIKRVAKDNKIKDED